MLQPTRWPWTEFAEFLLQTTVLTSQADLPAAEGEIRQLLLDLVEQNTPMVQPQAVAPYYCVNDGWALSEDLMLQSWA